MHRWKTAGIAAVAMSLLTFAGGAAVAGAHGKPAGSAAAERRLFAEESVALGREHALEHRAARRAARREAARLRALSPRGRTASRRALARAAQAEAATENPALDGRWDEPFQLPAYAINAALLPTGKVLFYSYPYQAGARPEEGTAYLWDPVSETFTKVTPPDVDQEFPAHRAPAQLFCSGQSFLPDGQLLVTGGNLFWKGQPEAPATATNYAGVKQAFTFDPWSETWKQQPDMSVGRWYPSQVMLADGRTFVIAGLTEEPGPGEIYGQYTDKTDIFTPGAGLGSEGKMEPGPEPSFRFTEFYPHLFLLPSGDVALAGAKAAGDAGPPASGVLRIDDTNPDSMQWDSEADSDMNTAVRTYASAVLAGGNPNGSGNVTIIGGYGTDKDDGVVDGVRHATNKTETRDFLQADPSWIPGPSLNIARSNADTVILPDGSLVTVGGGTGNDNGDQYGSTPEQRQVELFDGTSWRLGAAQARPRTYHATALLLPDGRVWSAGDDGHWMTYKTGTDPYNLDEGDAAEIYSPPYLFNADGSPAARPVIKEAPSAAPWDVPFYVSTPDDISRAVLVAPAAVTHKVDMNQRHVELRVVRRDAGHGLVVQAPPSAGVAPPGYYMLFLLDAHGVPSVARWVRLGGDAAAPAVPDPPAEPGPGTGDPGDGGSKGGGDHGGDDPGVGPGPGPGPGTGGSGSFAQPKVRVRGVRASTLRRRRMLTVVLDMSRTGKVTLRLTVGRGRRAVRLKAVRRRLRAGRNVVRLRVPASALRRGAPSGSIRIAVDVRQDGAVGVRHVALRAR